jgi:hypothetical protein
MTRDQPLHQPGSNYQIACQKSWKWLLLVRDLPFFITAVVLGIVAAAVAVGFWFRAKRARKSSKRDSGEEAVELI